MIAILAGLALAAQTSSPIEVTTFLSGNSLLRLCDPAPGDDPQLQKTSLCMGYVMATLDAHAIHETIRAETSSYRPTTCMPKGVEPSQLVEIAIKFLEDHPAQRHSSAAGLVIAAAMEAYPCT